MGRDPVLSQTLQHFVPCKARVLGVELGDFTLWHWRQLAIDDLPYSRLCCGGGLDDLMAGVMVCAVQGAPRTFKRSSGLWDRLKWKLMTLRFAHRWADEEDVFLSWIQYQLTPPARWNKGAVGTMQCPGWLVLAQHFLHHGWTEEAAWSLPVGRARCYLAARGACEGGGDWISEQDIEEMLEAGHSLDDLPLGN